MAAEDDEGLSGVEPTRDRADLVAPDRLVEIQGGPILEHQANPGAVQT